MSNTVTCERCRCQVTRGRAHIRSRRFEQVAWCDLCWLILHPPARESLLRRIRSFFTRAA